MKTTFMNIFFYLLTLLRVSSATLYRFAVQLRQIQKSKNMIWLRYVFFAKGILTNKQQKIILIFK